MTNVRIKKLWASFTLRPILSLENIQLYTLQITEWGQCNHGQGTSFAAALGGQDARGNNIFGKLNVLDKKNIFHVQQILNYWAK